jgi:hypothetical protein
MGRGLGSFDINNRIDRDLRRCRTHAMTARLFAAQPRDHGNAVIWEEIARSWDELAALKEQVRLSNASIARAQDQLATLMAGSKPESG